MKYTYVHTIPTQLASGQPVEFEGVYEIAPEDSNTEPNASLIHNGALVQVPEPKRKPKTTETS